MTDNAIFNGDFMKAFLFKHKKKLIAIASVLAVLVAAFAIYVGIYYHADDAAVTAYVDASGVTVTETASYFTVGDENAKRGMIFYPGAKVEARAYVPLAIELAKEGIFTVVVKMPFNISFFDINAANRVIRKYDSVGRWFVGGHSQGGSMAAIYAKNHQQKVAGVVLLGAYSTADLSGTNLSAFVAYGSNDGVLNMDKYEKNLKNLPTKTSYLVIDGGNHAGFGMYGEQKRDGVATISTEEQISLTAEMISGYTRK